MTDIEQPQKLYAQFVPNEENLHIRKWSKEPFEGACEYVLSSTPESRKKAMDELIAGNSVNTMRLIFWRNNHD